MRLAILVVGLALVLAKAADAEDAAAAYALGGAHGHLMSAAPCFPHSDEGKLVEVLLALSLRHLAAHPADRAAHDRGMTDARNQQRYIERSDPVACAQIRNVLLYYVATQVPPH